jgi:pre-mRNA-splicing factor SPF27
MLQAELKRVEAGESLPPLDTIRYQLPAPATSEPTDEDWKSSLGNAQAQLEHQRLRYACTCFTYTVSNFWFRHSNLALLQQYGANVWRVNNYRVESEAKSIEKELEYLKQRTTEVNRERKNFQVCRAHPQTRTHLSYLSNRNVLGTS